MADDLHQRDAGPVVVDQRVARLVDAPAPAHVGGLAGVLLQVGPHDAHPLATGKLQPAIGIDGHVVLADLVVLGHVGIEVVLPVKDRRLHRAVEGGADPNGILHGPLVEDRQGSG